MALSQQDVLPDVPDRPGLPLPDNMLINIGHMLDICDVRSLRLVCKQLEQIGTSVLKDTYTCLCVEPTKDSLQRFEALCKHPYFAPHIIKVLYLGSLYNDVLEDLHSFKWQVSGTMHKYELPDSVVLAEHEMFLRRLEEQREILESGADIECISRNTQLLPRFEEIMYGYTTTGNDLNVPQHSKEYLHRVTTGDRSSGWSEDGRWPPYTLSRWKEQNGLTIKQAVRRALDTETHYYAPGQPSPGQLRIMQICATLPVVHRPPKLRFQRLDLNFVDFAETLPAFNADIASSALANLASLTIVLDPLAAGFGRETLDPGQEGADQWLLLLKCAVNLQEFYWRWHCRDGNLLLSKLCENCTWPRLRKVYFGSWSISNTQVGQPLLGTTSSVQVTCMPVIPLNKLSVFLARHGKTLRSVSVWMDQTPYGSLDNCCHYHVADLQLFADTLRASAPLVDEAQIVLHVNRPKEEFYSNGTPVVARTEVHSIIPADFEHRRQNVEDLANALEVKMESTVLPPIVEGAHPPFEQYEADFGLLVTRRRVLIKTPFGDGH